MLWWKKVRLRPGCCKLAAVVIHRMLWQEGVAIPMLPHASCCHDPQNALVEEGCAILRRHASSLLL
jgi:hypothetical protein